MQPALPLLVVVAGIVALVLSTGCRVFTPRVAVPAERPLRMMTWNVGFFRGADGMIDLDRAIAVLRDWHPDVLLLQDIDRLSVRALGRNQAAILARELGMELHWQTTIPRDIGETGIATLTSIPLLEVIEKTNVVQMRGTSTPAAALGVRFSWGGREVVVWNVEFTDADVAIQYAQLRWLDGLMESDQIAGRHPIVGGSFSLSPDTTPWDALTDRMVDPWETLGSGRGYTMPSVRSSARHDYFLLPRGGAIVAITEYVVNALGVGAHLPVVIDLMVRPARSTADGEDAIEDDVSTTPPPVLDDVRMEPDAPLNERGGTGGIEPGERLPDEDTEKDDGELPGITKPFGPSRAIPSP